MVYKRFSVSCSLYNRQLKKPDTERAKRLGQLLSFVTGERESTSSKFYLFVHTFILSIVKT